MYKISLELVPDWAMSNEQRFPYSVDMICPFCGRQVNFKLNDWSDAKTINSRYAKSRCSGCGGSASFFWIGNPSANGNSEYELYIHPTPSLIRRPLDGIETVSQFSSSLKRAYIAALNSYNICQWTAAAVLCGRTLEGLTKALLPEDKQRLPLAQQLRELPNEVDLKQPILNIADGIRKGRNIAAHFDAEKEPDQETVEMMLDLLDYVIEYLFILPGRINRLHEKIAGTP